MVFCRMFSVLWLSPGNHLYSGFFVCGNRENKRERERERERQTDRQTDIIKTKEKDLPTRIRDLEENETCIQMVHQFRGKMI